MKYAGVSVIMRSQPQGASLLKPKTYFMYHQLEYSEILCSAHHVFMCFAWISEQLLFLYTTLTYRFWNHRRVFTARYELGLYLKQIQFRS